jgi:xanthine dehydrogenase YagR molybdenum-binding subunit
MIVRRTESQTMQTTRRGFLKGAVVGTAGVTIACADEGPRTAAGRHPDDAIAPIAGETVQLRTTVNGEVREAAVGADESALSFVRERVGLTGCKLGCGHGACGACAMQLDGVPVATCLLPALKLEGRKLTTIEGLAKGDTLHPVQRAFIHEDAMQCGYCTSGFVVEAAAFHDRWRAKQGTTPPTQDEVAKALAGHLCRCGAYPGIYRAVIAACSGAHDESSNHGPRHEAMAKVTGLARYTTDVVIEGMLVGKFLRSPHAHAKIRSIDYGPALAMPGVHGVVEFAAVGATLRYVGQEILALAAVDDHQARVALAEVKIEYELLEPVIGLDNALAPGALLVYAGKRGQKQAPNSSETPLLPSPWDGNLRGPFKLLSHHAKRAEKRLERAAESKEDKVEGEFETGTQIHTTLEPHAAVAHWQGERLLVHASTQAVRHLAEDIAQHYDLRRDDIEVRADYVGGAFGSKTSLSREIKAAIELARTCKRPVKVVLDRREELLVGGSRPMARMKVEICAGTEGQPAIVMSAQSDAGVAVGSTSTILTRLMYAQADQAIADYDVVSHVAPGCPFRGPGGPPNFFALEQMVDELAIVQGVDPIDLRIRWNQNPGRKLLYAWAKEQPLWRDRPPPSSDHGRFRRGIGVSGATWFYFAEPTTRVKLDCTPEGLVASTACQDMGNGSRSVLADVIAEVFGVEPHTITISIGSSKAVSGPMSAGSRTATSIGPAARAAAIDLRDELVEIAEKRLGLIDAVAMPGGIAHSKGKTAWAEVFDMAPPLSATGKRGRDKGGFFMPPIQGTAAGRYLSSAVQISEVEIDTRLGRVRLIHTVAGYAIGKVYSPMLARNQAEGGLVQGIGYSLCEERRLDPRDGRMLTGNLEDYRLPGLADIGELDVHFVPGSFENVIGEGVGLAEIVTLTPGATIANAVRHATGWRPKQIPLRPDRVLAGLASVAGAEKEVK